MSGKTVVEAVFPPTPPDTDKGESDSSSVISEDDCGGLPPVPRSVEPAEVLAVDANSPDKHVKRDPRLIRLTGNHPFNCEAPLTTLFEAGACPRSPQSDVKLMD